MKRPTRRADSIAENPNHHLWCHAKHWWVYCSIRPTHCTKDKVRRSLATPDLEVARFRRDELFRRLHDADLLGYLHAVKLGSRPTNQKISPGPLPPWKERVDAIVADVTKLFPPPVRKKTRRIRVLESVAAR